MSLKSCLCLIGLTLALALSLPAQTVRVLLVAGTADITPTGETVARPIVKGEAVTAGSTITTGADGRVVLTPMPGVKSIITPNSTITLESVSETPGAHATTAYQATLDLKVGAVVSDLNKPADATYDYSIRTPRGLAGARGTTFTVGVNPAGIATVVVAHGTISLTFTDGRTASLTPGKVSITKPDGTTVEAERISDLSPEDQAIANNWTEITLEAINAAVDAGVELSPETLKNVTDTADSLGLELSEQSQTLLETLQEKLDGINEEPAQNENDSRDIVGQSGGSTDTPAPLTDIERFRAGLTTDQLAVFDQLNETNQKLLVTIDDSAVTTAALGGDSITGVSFTNLDLETNLTAITKLSTSGLAFLKAANGDNLTEGYGPGPADWSASAFDRSAASWTALSAADQNLLLSLGATAAVMDRSATFLTAFINGVRDLPANQRTAIAETGWGFILFEEYFRDNYYTNQAISTATQLTSAQRALIKFFDLDPYEVLYSESSLGQQLDLLQSLSSSQREQLRKLDLGEHLLYIDSTSITRTLNRIAALNTTQRQAVIELGLGKYFAYANGETIQLESGGTVTVAQRLQTIINAYLGMSATKREALRDARIFESYHSYLSSSRLDTANLAYIVDIFLELPARTRAVLVSSHDFSLLDLLDFGSAGTIITASESSYRSLESFANIVAGLSDAELETLRDMEREAILLNAFVYESDANALASIKSVISFYNGLSILQKFTLRELGILQSYDLAWLTVNKQGLTRLLTSYSQLPGTLRAGTTFVEYTSSATTIDSPSVFVSNSYYSFYDVSFVTSGNQLHVGAIKNLVIQGNNYSEDIPTFTTAANGSLFLRASDLIDLYNVNFHTNIRSITMEAATINLANVAFNNHSTIALNSRLGGNPNFGSSVSGRVNFMGGVTYAGHLLDSQSQFDTYGKNIKIGTLANPATPGAYKTVPNFVMPQ